MAADQRANASAGPLEADVSELCPDGVLDHRRVHVRNAAERGANANLARVRFGIFGEILEGLPVAVGIDHQILGR